WASLTVRALRIDLNTRGVGRRFTTTDGSQSLDPYVVFDGQLSYTQQFGPADATIAIVAENVTDLRYEVIQSYVMPPRHFTVRLIIQAR
ncbi:MAG: hypothetical protein R3284_09320, partial [Rubricoccaceae bacterium]|nr:hypothetical protein [Rubricoccaceae bacterium]